MTNYEQSARLADTIASHMERFGRNGKTPTMAQIRRCWDLSGHPLEWLTLNHQIEYAMKHLTPGALRRQADDLRTSAQEGPH